ncbi:hypothetical protein SNK03_004517 [Fusarium graminearum]
MGTNNVRDFISQAANRVHKFAEMAVCLHPITKIPATVERYHDKKSSHKVQFNERSSILHPPQRSGRNPA